MTFKIEPDWEGEAHYTIIFDGGSEGNPGPGYGSYAIITKTGRKRFYRLTFGEMSSNEAEYRALASALSELISIIEGAGRSPEEFTLEVQGDSALVINQVLGLWKAREQNLKELRDEVRRLLGRFKAWRLVKVPRTQVKKKLGH
ncbi:MAG: ribonuclease HI family protein [Anaerolineae bacterium]|nr:ribonuclease HI family protein [Anaerolineae bacterium]MDW8101476.1 ribonuclease HI family protein [Anaerolineae bacterium]